MSKEFDTSWFDLNNYAAFETMPLEEWHYQLTCRRELDREFSIHQSGRNANFSARMKGVILKNIEDGVLKIKESPLWRRTSNYQDEYKVRRSNSFGTASVNSLDSSDVHLLFRSDDKELSPLFESCRDDFNNDVPFDFQLKKLDANFINIAHIQLNLSASDEQLKNDFDYWLKNYRKEAGVTANRKYFSKYDLDKWFKFCAIPYLDLLLIAKIEDKKITQHKLANLIFPNEFDVDVVGRLRDTTKPMAEKLKKHDTHSLISLQVANEKVGRKTL